MVGKITKKYEKCSSKEQIARSVASASWWWPSEANRSARPTGARRERGAYGLLGSSRPRRRVSSVSCVSTLPPRLALLSVAGYRCFEVRRHGLVERLERGGTVIRCVVVSRRRRIGRVPCCRRWYDVIECRRWYRTSIPVYLSRCT